MGCGDAGGDVRSADRHARMDIGLGVWTNGTRRYYPMERIRERGGALLDKVDDRTLLVYIEPESSTPVALFVDATRLQWDERTLRLDTGDVVGSRCHCESVRRSTRARASVTVFHALVWVCADVSAMRGVWRQLSVAGVTSLGGGRHTSAGRPRRTAA